MDEGGADNYRRLYMTQWNQVGRSFPGAKGASCDSMGGWLGPTSQYMLGSDPYASDSPKYIWAIVIDKTGTYHYRIPSDTGEEIWPGLTRTTAACTLPARPNRAPENDKSPCRDDPAYCGLFMANCQVLLQF